ncbi:MAG: GspE/PulE family protein [Paracoccaceae bacterium]
MLELRDKELIDALRIAKAVPENALSRIAAACEDSGLNVERALIELGLMKDEDLAVFLAKWLNIPLFEQGDFQSIDAAQLSLDYAFLKRVTAAPVAFDGDRGLMTIALGDPRNEDLLKTLAFHLGYEIKRGVASGRTISAMLERMFNHEKPAAQDVFETDDDVERLVASANDGPVINLVQDIVAKAVDRGASDIHIEAQDGHAQVRYRVDGQLRRERTLSSSDRKAAVSRLKIMADLNISEVRRPQDGRIRITVRGRNIDLRLSALPTQYGESVVMRVLDQSKLKLNWEALGFAAPRIAQLNALVQSPNGIFLVTGPTGSGKTTTLYTALSQLDTDALKIITLEDPIEYSLQGINQVQVQPEIGMTFGAALRAVLRQDPDVVLVGEIRDAETAENAVRAALMGRLVLSTIHTNSAVGAINRLVDLGVPPFLLGVTLRGILSQRLVRSYCIECAGTGCNACGESGYSGRQVVSELLELDQELREAVGNGLRGDDLFALAQAQNFETISQNAQSLVTKNQTSTAEIFRVVGEQ